MSNIEKRCLITLLIFTALAGASVAMPDLVWIGAFLLILPGLILVCSPTIALYGWLFAVPYAGIRTVGLASWPAALLALLALLAFGIGLPAQRNAEARTNLTRAVATDVRPTRPLPIGGTVASVHDSNIAGWRDNDDCDDLCLHLLYNGNAKAVYLGQIGRSGMAFTVERRAACPPVALSRDLSRWHQWPNRAMNIESISWPPPPGLEEVVQARIASGDCLMRVGGIVRPDWTIERVAISRGKGDDRWSIAPGDVRGERISVYHRDGLGRRLVGRFTHAYVPSLSVPLTLTMIGGVGDSRWTWRRGTFGEDRWEWNSVGALRSLVAFDTELPKGILPTRTRELLAAALTDPRRAQNEAGLLLANSVMADIARSHARAGDAALLAKAIGDDRFTKIEPRYEIAKKLGVDYEMIVNSAIARFGRLPTSDAKTFPYRSLDTIIASMPATWFRSPPSSLTDLLRDPIIAAKTAGVIHKLDAGGAAAVPLLTDIVTRGAERVSGIKDDGHTRGNESDGIDAAVAALCRIGTPARSALGPIIAAKQKLISTTDRWRDRNPGKYSALWRGQKVNDGFVVTLVSLGVPITQFRAPDQPSSTMNGSWQGKVMFDVKDHDCEI